jgi:adenosylmethionine-8-amino-7-oxononanoate aminotransferase
MANPLAAAVAVASIDLLVGGDWRAQVSRIETQLAEQLEPYRRHPDVKDVRVLGAIGVVELRQPVDLAAAQKIFVDNGVWIRPFGKYIYLMPPYIIESGDLGRLTAAIGLALN